MEREVVNMYCVDMIAFGINVTLFSSCTNLNGRHLFSVELGIYSR